MRTSADLRAYGVTARQERNRIADGDWTRPMRGVVGFGPAGPDDRLVAAVLRAGRDAALSHQTGTTHLLNRSVTGTIHVGIRNSRRLVDPPGVRYHQIRHWQDPIWWNGIPVFPPALLGAQVCATGDLPDEDDRRALATGLIQTGLTTADAIAECAAHTSRRVRRQVTRTVEELLAGAQSAKEAKFWRMQVEAGLPLPALNHPLEGGRFLLDGYLAPLRAGYEVQSREHHQTTWLHDTARLNRITVHHRIPLLFVPVPDIDNRPDRALADLEAFWRGRADDLRLPMPRFIQPEPWHP